MWRRRHDPGRGGAQRPQGRSPAQREQKLAEAVDRGPGELGADRAHLNNEFLKRGKTVLGKCAHGTGRPPSASKPQRTAWF